MKRYLLLILCLLLPGQILAQDEDFPGRAVYPKVKVYDTETLNKSFGEVIIVDVRSKYEYDTLHVNTAVNVPLNSNKFSQKIAELQAGSKPLVFYCNGHTCYKSYKAVVKADKAGLNNIFAYDSGIFDWAKAHPDKATMLGKSPVDPKRLISKSELKKFLLDPKQFAAKIDSKTLILDIREPAQRGLTDLYPYRQENISMDKKEKLNRYLTKVKKSGQTLLIYDEAGKQVRWLQYYLQDIGLKNYYFMAGGAKQFFKDIRS
jgi:rhodanese-related sulfurtransferase